MSHNTLITLFPAHFHVEESITGSGHIEFLQSLCMNLQCHETSNPVLVETIAPVSLDQILHAEASFRWHTADRENESNLGEGGEVRKHLSKILDHKAAWHGKAVITTVAAQSSFELAEVCLCPGSVDCRYKMTTQLSQVWGGIRFQRSDWIRRRESLPVKNIRQGRHNTQLLIWEMIVQRMD